MIIMIIIGNNSNTVIRYRSAPYTRYINTSFFILFRTDVIVITTMTTDILGVYTEQKKSTVTVVQYSSGGFFQANKWSEKYHSRKTKSNPVDNTLSINASMTVCPYVVDFIVYSIQILQPQKTTKQRYIEVYFNYSISMRNDDIPVYITT